MEDVQALSELAIMIGAAVGAAFITTKLKLPTLLGYLISGIILSLIFTSEQDSHFLENIAQLGAALLLFTIGIEFSLQSIRKVAKIVTVGAIVQAILVIAFSFVVLPLFGFNEYQTFFVGVLASTSSTAFVLKMLEGRNENHARHGLIMLGWLVMQDIMIVIWFLLLEVFSPSNEMNVDLLTALTKGAIVIGVTFGMGRYVLPILMKQIAKTKSDELLIVSVVGVIAAFAVFANLLGVSFTVGAFLAGLALSESFLHHEIFTETKPIRNLFIMVFFVSIGSLFDFNSMNILYLLSILLVLIPIKILAIILINLWFGVHIKNSIKIGLGISQIGEFAFLGAQLGLSSGWIDVELYSSLVAATVISMAITPLLYANADWLYNFLEKRLRSLSPNLHRNLFINTVPAEITSAAIDDHIVLAGYGRVGIYIAAALRHSKLPFLVVELSTARMEKAKEDGIPVVYGDASKEDILLSASIQNAKALVVALPAIRESNLVIKAAKKINPKIKIVARTHKIDHELELELIDHAVEPEFVAAVEIVNNLYKIMHRRNKRAVEAIEKQALETQEITEKEKPQENSITSKMFGT